MEEGYMYKSSEHRTAVLYVCSDININVFYIVQIKRAKHAINYHHSKIKIKIITILFYYYSFRITWQAILREGQMGIKCTRDRS